MNICSMCITDFQRAFGKCTWFLKIITVVIGRGKKLGFLVPLRGRPTPTKMHLVRLLDACSLRYIFKQSIQKWNVTKKSTHWSSSAQIASFFPLKVAAFGCFVGCLWGYPRTFCLVKSLFFQCYSMLVILVYPPTTLNTHLSFLLSACLLHFYPRCSYSSWWKFEYAHYDLR